jgi:hypothetical protein
MQAELRDTSTAAPMGVDEEVSQAAKEALSVPTEPSTHKVGKEGARGFWGVAQSMLGAGASNAEVQRLAQELMTANPGVTTLHVGDELNLGDGSVSAEALRTYAEMDAGYQVQLAAAAQARAEQDAAAAAQVSSQMLPSHSEGVSDDFLERVRWEDEKWALEQTLGHASAQQGAPWGYHDQFGNRFDTFCASCHDGSDAANRNLGIASNDPGLNFVQGGMRLVAGGAEVATGALLSKTGIGAAIGIPMIGLGINEMDAAAEQMASLRAFPSALEGFAIDELNMSPEAASLALGATQITLGVAAGFVIAPHLAAAEAQVLRRPGDVYGIQLPRTPGLGAESTTAELLAAGSVPGREGVILNQKTVSFPDVWKISENLGVEVSLAREEVGGVQRFVLRSGSPSEVPIAPEVRPIAHTHLPDVPGAVRPELPSTKDIRVLDRLFEGYLRSDPSVRPPMSRVVWGPAPDNQSFFRPVFR